MGLREGDKGRARESRIVLARMLTQATRHATPHDPKPPCLPAMVNVGIGMNYAPSPRQPVPLFHSNHLCNPPSPPAGLGHRGVPCCGDHHAVCGRGRAHGAVLALHAHIHLGHSAGEGRGTEGGEGEGRGRERGRGGGGGGGVGVGMWGGGGGVVSTSSSGKRY